MGRDGFEDHRGGYHGSRQRTAPRLVHTSHPQPHPNFHGAPLDSGMRASASRRRATPRSRSRRVRRRRAAASRGWRRIRAAPAPPAPGCSNQLRERIRPACPALAASWKNSGTSSLPASRLGCEKCRTFTSPSRTQQERGDGARAGTPPPWAACRARSRASRCPRPPAPRRPPPARGAHRRRACAHRARGACAAQRVGKQVTQGGRHHGSDAHQSGVTRARATQPRRRKTSASRSTSARRLPGNTASTRAVGADAQLGARRGAIDVHRNLVGQRMSDEGRAHTVLAIEIRLERKQAQDEVDCFADGARPSLPPRPDLGTHVLHGAQSLLLETPRESQVEFLEVDADEHVRPPFEDPPLQLRAQPQQARRWRRTSVSPMTPSSSL